MPLTPSGGLTSYLSATDYCRAVDARWVADKLSIDGARVGGNADGSVNTAALALTQELIDALQEASGLVEAACLKGGRYHPDDLAALTGNSLRFLKRLVANLTTGILLHDRRPEPGVALTPSYLMALDWLAELESGAKIFAFAETQDAGLPDLQIDTPDVVRDRRMVTRSARRYFGRRNNEEWGR